MDSQAAGGLSKEQVERFHRDGFLFPLPGLTPAEASRYRSRLEEFEEEKGAPLTSLGTLYKYKLHLLLPWANEIACHPAILAAVESLLGPDILIFTSAVFIKEASSPSITAWHQDATYFGLQRPDSVNAWVALSESSLENGCLRFLAGSHRGGQLRHEVDQVPHSVNSMGRTIVEPFDRSNPVQAPLLPGEFSLHDSLVVHSSPPNRTADRRIGLSFHYIPTQLPHTGSQRMSALLARGKDEYGHYDLEAHPADPADPATQAAHEEAVWRYRDSHAERVERLSRA